MIRFFLYYYALFIIYFLILNFFLKDFLNSFMIASAIISSGGYVGNNGHLLGFYFSNDFFLVIYSILIIFTILILIFVYLIKIMSLKFSFLNNFFLLYSNYLEGEEDYVIELVLEEPIRDQEMTSNSANGRTQRIICRSLGFIFYLYFIYCIRNR